MNRRAKLNAAQLPRIEAALRETLDNPQLWQYRFGKRAKRLNMPQLELSHTHAREINARWGRRCGKSVYLGENDIPRWMCRHGDTSTWVMAPTQDQAGIIHAYLMGILEDSPLELLIKSQGSSPWPHLQLWNDARVTARNLGYDGKNVRGNTGDRLVVDEAAFVGDATIERAVSPIIASSPWAETVNISTPNGLNWYWKRCMAGVPGNADVRALHHPTWHNAFIDRKFLLAEKRKRSSIAWRVEYGAEFVEDQNAQFPYSLIESCIDPDAVWTRVPLLGHKYVIGYDPADVHDRSAVIVLDITTRPWRVVDRDAIGGFGYTNQAQRIAELSYRWNHAPIHMDTTSHAPFAEQLSNMRVAVISGYQVEVELSVAGFHYTNPAKLELIENLRITMEQQDLLMPWDDDIVSELKFFRREVTGAGNIRMNALEGEFDDYVNALALAVMMAGWQASQPKAKFGTY